MINDQAEDLGIPVLDVCMFTKLSRNTGQQNYYAKITFESRTLPAYMTVGSRKWKYKKTFQSQDSVSNAGNMAIKKSGARVPHAVQYVGWKTTSWQVALIKETETT